MKRVPALLLAGLLGLSAAYAQAPEQPAAAPPSAEPAVQAAEQSSAAKPAKVRDDYITLNFSNIDIAALIKVMSEFTRRNFILDEKVVGKVTLMTPTRVSPDEAYQIFLSALEIKGFTAIEDGKITRIIPIAMARQSGLKVVQHEGMKGEGFVTKLVRTSYVNPQEVVRTLTPLITKDGSLLAYPATSSVIITDTVPAIRKIERLIEAMDVPTPAGKGRISVYNLKNANAEDIARVMQALVARLPAPPSAGVPGGAGPATILEGAVTITADKLTNSLIIVASPGDFETMRDVIAKLDVARRQVYVEAAIIEMGLTKSRELGFEFRAMTPLDNSKITAVGGTNFGGIGNATVSGPAAFASMNGLAVGAVKGTFTFRGQEFLNIGALLRALQSDSDVNVLSTPNILTTDNQKAEIMVGQNVPFTTGQTQNATTGSGSIFNTIERRDVGIKLAITPQISSQDNVRLEISQEISDVVPASALNTTGLITNKRSANTTVVVRDQETMVIGGLIRDNETASESKVPLLGDIPLLGWLFKYRTTRVEKTNLMIFITPYIIKNDKDAAELTRRKAEYQEEFRKEQKFEKKGREADARRSAEADAAGGTKGTVASTPSASAPQPSEPAVSAPSTTAPSATEGVR